jgi:SAM-dependent methyltransferase
VIRVEEVVCVDWEHSAHRLVHADHLADLDLPLDFLPDGRSDTVLCTDVLEHLHTPEVLFAEMARIARPRGHLIVGVPFLYWVHEAPHDHHRFTAHKLRQWCQLHQLDVVELKAYGGWPEVVFDLVHKGVDFLDLPLKGLFLACWRGIGSLAAKVPAMRRMSLRTRATLPMGHVLVARKPG